MNKFFIVLLTACILLPASLFPQKKFEGGLTVGTGFSGFSGLDAEYIREDISSALSEAVGEYFPIETFERNFTLTLGGFVTYNALPWLGLRGGVEYVPKGKVYSGDLYLSTNLNMESTVLEYSSVFKLTYLEFPVALQLSNRSKKKTKDIYFFVNMGVAPAMNLSARIDMTLSLVERGFNNSGVTSDVIESENDIEDIGGINEWDLGILASAGVVFNSIGIDVKLTNGRKSIFENPDEGYIRNNNITASMWFVF